MNDLLKQLKGGMIVSCQAEGDDPFNADPEYMALFARAAEMGGAIGIRTQGIEKLKAIKRAVNLPVIGLLKSLFPDGTVCITGSFKEVEQLIEAGSDIVAIDGTFRKRDGLTGPEFIREVKNKGAVPVILTSVCRLQFKDGEPVHSHKTYPEKAKQAASDNGVVALDIEQLSWDWLNDLGYDNAKLRYMISTEDSTDTTHLNELGATEIAQITANALKACGNPDLAKLAK